MAKKKSNKNHYYGSKKKLKPENIDISKITPKKISPIIIIILVIVLVGVGVGGYFIYKNFTKEKTQPVVITGDLSFSFLELGNASSGDCTYIKAGDNDILIDAGSNTNSLSTIKSYLDKYVTDGKLEYVIVTHAHLDHIACFAGTTSENSSLFDFYKCGIIIDFNKHNTDSLAYQRYIEKRDKEVSEDGAVHYTALECVKEENGAKKKYNLTDDGSISFEILYQKFYENTSSSENNYSVCTLFRHGDRNFLLTGDLENDGESSLVDNNSLPQVELYKAGHHGSKTSSYDKLLSVIKPKVVTVCCCAGNDEYTKIQENQFPTQDFINRISKYTKLVYVTTLGYTDYTGGATFVSMNGNIVVSSDSSKGVTVNCSNNNTLLKDTDWFKAKRTCPSYWL